jgi:hypothetical protein
MDTLTDRWDDRRSETLRLLRWLEPNPRLPEPARRVAEAVAELVGPVLERTGDGDELTAGLRKLLEAKDCFVRQVLVDQEAVSASIDRRDRRPPAGLAPVEGERRRPWTDAPRA